jgi:hypothetical protein
MYTYYYSREEGFQTPPPKSPESNVLLCNFIKTSRKSVEDALALNVQYNNTTYIKILNEVLQDFDKELMNEGCAL